MRRWRLPILVLTISGVGYVGGYLYVRSQNLLVHYSSFANGNTDSHRIDIGDLGPGFNPSNQTARISYYIFTPLRWVETGFWYMRYPRNKPWPYAQSADAHDRPATAMREEAVTNEPVTDVLR